MEGMGVAVFNILKEQIQQSLKSKIGALLMKPALRGIKHKMDYSEYGGGLLLGIDGAVVKCHGTSKAKTIKNAVLQAYDFANNGVVEAIRKEIKE
jgi:glycerol-3-phosphate acyltransferase PlsX